MVIEVVYGSLKGNEVLITDIIDLYMYYFDFPADGSRMSSRYKMIPTKGRVSRKGIFFQFPQTHCVSQRWLCYFLSSPSAHMGPLGWGVETQGWRDTGDLGNHSLHRKVLEGKDTLLTHMHAHAHVLEEADITRRCREVSGPL